MRSHRKELWFETPTRVALINITGEVQAAVRESGVKEGLATERKYGTRHRAPSTWGLARFAEQVGKRTAHQATQYVLSSRVSLTQSVESLRGCKVKAW
jgi:hypothetical protein